MHTITFYWPMSKSAKREYESDHRAWMEACRISRKLARRYGRVAFTQHFGNGVVEDNTVVGDGHVHMVGCYRPEGAIA